MDPEKTAARKEEIMGEWKMTDIERFEKLMQTVSDRPGFDRLMNYIRKSDFYTAPASTKYHLSCEGGGLLQHSLDVYDALRWRLQFLEVDGKYHYIVSGQEIASFSEGTIVVCALLHDICKTGFYAVEYRNKKVYSDTGSTRDAAGRFDWQTVPAYTVNDRNPYGHGEKSVMMIEEFIKLTMEERYAIRWHMGMGDCSYNQIQVFNASCELYPLVLLLHNADQEASHFMEDAEGRKEIFREAAKSVAEGAGQPVFMEAATL